MRLLISAGGTGGGVYPALSVAGELQRTEAGFGNGAASSSPAAPERPPVEILWVGSRGGMEADIVARAGLPFQAIHGGGVHGVGWRLPLNALNLARGFFEAANLVRRFKPRAAFVTGGFMAVPVALAAWLHGAPVVVYLPDLEPALGIRLVSRVARKIAVTAEASKQYFDAAAARKVIVTGYPTRPDFKTATRAAAREHFGLDPRRPAVLVTGGSRGARSLNRALTAALPDLLKDFEVIHLSGQLDWAETEQARAALPEAVRAHYHAFPYLHAMGLALSAADLVVSRAGASALGEYPLFGLPAILVPYPHAWRYQKVNADYLVERGAAVRINDEDLPARLASEVRRLLADPDRLARMRQAASASATPEAARRIAQELVTVARQESRP